METTARSARPAAHGAERLRRNAIGAPGAAVVAMAFMAPATSVYFNTSLAAAGAGYAFPLAMLLALAACGLVAWTVAEFARKLPSAGFAYTFATHGFGRGGGFMAGWILALAYAMVGPMLLSGAAEFGAGFARRQWEAEVPPWTLVLAFGAFVWGVAALGLDRSARTALVLLAVEMGVLAALAATILARGGAEGLSATPLTPAGAPGGVAGLGTGMLWGILCFIGFESAGTLAEETRDPRRGVPRALFASVGIIGAFYVLTAYAAVAGFGRGGMGALAGDTEPWATLAGRYWGDGLRWAVSLTVLTSVAAALVGGCNAAVRVLFALGREGILLAGLGRVSRSGRPLAALAACMLFSLSAALLGLATVGPVAVWSFCGTVIGLGMIVVYILVCLALPAYYRRAHPAEFSPLRHGVLPAAAGLLMLLPVYGLMWPVPPFPNNLVPHVVAGWAALGAVHLAVLSRRRPRVLEGMGRVWAGEGA